MTAVAMMLAVCASAQMTKMKEFESFSSIPKELSGGDELEIIVNPGTNDDLFDIYDADFNKIKSISIDWPKTTSYEIIEERDSVVTESYNSESWIGTTKEVISTDYSKEQLTFTWEEAQQYAAAYVLQEFNMDENDYIEDESYSEDLTYTTWRDKQVKEAPTDHIIVDNSTHTIYINPNYEYTRYGSSYKASDYHYYYYEQYGNKYPTEYFVYKPEEGFLYRVTNSYKSTFTGDWKTKRNNYSSFNIYTIDPYYRDLDNNSERVSSRLSKSLFNSDANYEYILPILSPYTGETSETDRDGDGTVDIKRTYHGHFISGLKIMSDNGNTLQEINIRNSIGSSGRLDISFYKINNQFYGLINYSTDEGYMSDLYRIDPTTSSVKRMENVQLAIRPNVVDRSSMVTVELDDTDTARELVVTGMDGRIVERRDIPAGERQIQVPAARMASGMYNFTIRKRGAVEKNGKVIVK